jgi:hypothetical protein
MEALELVRVPAFAVHDAMDVCVADVLVRLRFSAVVLGFLFSCFLSVDGP